MLRENVHRQCEKQIDLLGGAGDRNLADDQRDKRQHASQGPHHRAPECLDHRPTIRLALLPHHWNRVRISSAPKKEDRKRALTILVRLRHIESEFRSGISFRAPASGAPKSVADFSPGAAMSPHTRLQATAPPLNLPASTNPRRPQPAEEQRDDPGAGNTPIRRQPPTERGSVCSSPVLST